MIERYEITSYDAAQRMWQLQQAAYRIEAERIGWPDLPPLRESAEELMECGETFYAAMLAGDLAGAVSFKKVGQTLDIHRMVVDPKHFRKGIASNLLVHLEKANPEAGSIIVSTAARNEPAIKLYQRHGYVTTGTQEVAPELVLQFFKKDL